MKLVDTNIFVHYLSGGPRAGEQALTNINPADLITQAHVENIHKTPRHITTLIQITQQ